MASKSEVMILKKHEWVFDLLTEVYEKWQICWKEVLI